MNQADTPTAISEGLERKNVENILLKQKAGKILTDAEKQQVAEWADRERTRDQHDKAGIGHEVANVPGVRALIDELQRRSAAKTILSLNDRLGLLAKTAQRPVRSASDANAQARVIEVYSKISGDQAPERRDVVLRGDPEAPLQTVTRPATKAEKIAALLALRKARQPAAPEPQPTPAS